MPRIMLLIDVATPTNDRDPLNSMAGKDFIKDLHQAGILVSDCYVTAVCKHHIPMPHKKTERKKRFFLKNTEKNKILKPEVEQYFPLVTQEINNYNPTVIIACGDLALWFLYGQMSVFTWRGSILSTNDPSFFRPYKFIPTFSPETLQSMFEWRWIAIEDFKRAKKESVDPKVILPAWEFIIRPSVSEILAYIGNIIKHATTPTESNGERFLWWVNGMYTVNPKPADIASNQTAQLILGGDIESRTKYIRCFGIAKNSLEAMCIPFMSLSGNPHHYSYEEEVLIVLALRKLFLHPRISWIFQNGNYDFQYFAKQWGMLPRLHRDTMTSHHVAWSGTRKGLDFLASIYCSFYRYWKDDGKDFHDNIYTVEQEEEYWVYNCKDAAIMMEIAPRLEESIKVLKQKETEELQYKQQKAALKMMLRGFRVDEEVKANLALELLEAKDSREKLLNYINGGELNPRSHKQMLEFFHETWGVKRIYSKKTGGYTYDAEALEQIGQLEPHLKLITDLISEIRSIGVFFSTFVNATLSEDKRARTMFNVAGPETFRWSSSKDAFGQGLNLQNLPKGSEE